MNRNQSKQKIQNLVQTFHTEKREKINEAETRLRFIDPFFEALSWDIRNPKEVRVESTLARSDSTRPDYRFLIDGKTKFFVEAKKPAVKLTDPAPIFQAKSYGFSSKVPLVILTDFEEFRPFRTLARPKFDKPLDGLIKEFDYTYERYLEEFDNLYDTFSRDAVAAGELEKRIPTAKKEASATVDKEFLNDLSKWQEELAKNIALRNPKLTVGEINEAVQRILDRIIFLRICEDRQIEESEILLSYADKEEIYPKLLKEFTRLRSKYNGLIFNEHRLSEQLTIDDKLLKDIIKNLYLPYSPYRFNEIPIAILGTIYEQYLGKVITLTPTHRAKVEVKPEVRKAGGVFYTPQFITSYIVKNTIGKLLTPSVFPPYKGGEIPVQAGRGVPTPEQISKLKFADIACGSGSFLLEMFDFLIRYHVDYYSANPDKVKTVDGVPDAFQTPETLWHLSTRKKKEILLNNIHGVDIDSQAVEVTQMSLYLKLLEGESAETFGKQLTLELKETILPSLSNNIKCGNSLVGMDIKGLGNNLSLDEELRIRPFDWETAFPEVMRNGGFDSIIGNPPWIDIKGLDPVLVDYYFANYKTTENRINVYAIFVERALGLLKGKGKFGYIIPNSVLTQSSYTKLRKFILEEHRINNIVRLPDNTFENVKAETTIILIDKQRADVDDEVEIIIFGRNQPVQTIETSKATKNVQAQQENWKSDDMFLFNIFVSDAILNLVKKISNVGVQLEEICDFCLGLTPYDKYKGHTRAQIENRVFHSRKKIDKTYKKLLSGEDITRYYVEWKNGEWISYGPWLGAPREQRFFTVPRIVVRQIVSGNPLRIFAAYTEEELYNTQIAFNIVLKEGQAYSLKYILGILNSELMNFFHRSKFLDQSKNLFQKILIQNARLFPIRRIDFNKPEEKAMHDQMVQLVERMLDLHKKKHQVKTDSGKELFEHQIKATDKEINELVYKLYEINEDERTLLERGSL